jgi:hypothetical protein
MSKLKTEELSKILDEFVFSIKKNIESNSEQTEDSILNRFSRLEKLIYKVLGENCTLLISDDECEDEDEENDDKLNNEDTKIADKFKLPKVKTNRSLDTINNIESNILDTNCRLENLENSIGGIQVKINELIKVNNAILKRLETTNSNFVQHNIQDKPSPTIQEKPSLTIPPSRLTKNKLPKS